MLRGVAGVFTTTGAATGAPPTVPEVEVVAVEDVPGVALTTAVLLVGWTEPVFETTGGWLATFVIPVPVTPPDGMTSVAPAICGDTETPAVPPEIPPPPPVGDGATATEDDARGVVDVIVGAVFATAFDVVPDVAGAIGVPVRPGPAAMLPGPACVTGPPDIPPGLAVVDPGPSLVVVPTAAVPVTAGAVIPGAAPEEEAEGATGPPPPAIEVPVALPPTRGTLSITGVGVTFPTTDGAGATDGDATAVPLLIGLEELPAGGAGLDDFPRSRGVPS